MHKLEEIFGENTIWNYILYIVLIITISSSAVSYVLYTQMSIFKNTMENTLTRSIESHGYVDYSYICNISDCNSIYIYKDNNTLTPQYDGTFIITNGHEMKKNALLNFRGLMISKDMNVIYSLKNSGLLVESNTSGALICILKMFYTFELIAILIFSVVFFEILI